MLKKIVLGAITASVVVVSLSNVASAGIKIPGQSSSAAATTGDAKALQEQLVTHYKESQVNIMQALAHFNAANGNRAEAAKLEASAQAMKDASTKQAMAAVQAESASALQSYLTDTAAAGTLSAEAKKEFTAGLLPYANGAGGAVQLTKDLQAFSDAAKSQISAASALDKAKVASSLEAGLWIAKELPAYSAALSSGFTKIVEFSQKQGIDTASTKEAFANVKF